MGIEDKLNSLNASKSQELLKALSDAKIDDKEAEKLGLTPAEQQELTAALSCGKAFFKDGKVVFEEGTRREPKMQEEKGFWDSTAGKVVLGVGAFAGTALLAGLVGASAPVACLLGAGALLFTSCAKDDFDPGKRDNNITQTVQITITGNENMETLLDYVAVLVAQGEKNGAKMDAEIVKLIGDNNDLLGTVVALLIENNDLLKKNNQLITDFAAQNHNDNKEILKAVLALQKGVAGIQALLQVNNKLLANLPQNIANEFKGKLNEILEAINAGNMSLAELKDKMNDVIKLLAQIKALVQFNDVQNEVIIRLLAKIEAGQELTNEELMEALELLNNISNTTAEINETTKKALEVQEEIRDLIKGMNADQKAYFEQLIELAGMNLEELKGIKNLINFYGTGILQGLGAILGAINANTAESKAIKGLLLQVLAKMEKMDNNNKAGFKAILDAIADLAAKIGQGGTVDLSTVEALLAEIRDLTKANGGKLDNIIGQNDVIISLIKGMNADLNAKLDLVNGKLDQLDANQKEIITFLKALKDRADVIINLLNNPQCDMDFEKLMAKLQEILEAIKDHEVKVDVTGKVTVECHCDCGHKPNEGIIGDLDDLINGN